MNLNLAHAIKKECFVHEKENIDLLTLWLRILHGCFLLGYTKIGEVCLQEEKHAEKS